MVLGGGGGARSCLRACLRVVVKTVVVVVVVYTLLRSLVLVGLLGGRLRETVLACLREVVLVLVVVVVVLLVEEAVLLLVLVLRGVARGAPLVVVVASAWVSMKMVAFSKGMEFARVLVVVLSAPASVLLMVVGAVV